jgi:hypothetical protein
MAKNGKRQGDDAAMEESEEVAACFPIFMLGFDSNNKQIITYVTPNCPRSIY